MKNNINISMVGLGNMGTAIANIIAQKGINVIGWDYFKEVIDEINNKHTNSKFLTNISLSINLFATDNLQDVIQKKDIIFIALPSTYIKKVLTPFSKNIDEKTLIVNLSKGINEESGLTSSQIIRKIFAKNEVITLSGPSIANEFSRGYPCGVVIAGANKDNLYKIAKIVETDTFRVRFSEDIIGVEWSGILKNIYAIGLGLIDGPGISSINFKAAYITKAIEEIADLIEALGGKRKTAYYLAGLGDLIATSLSKHSHNRKLGELLSKGLTFDEAKNEMGVLPEGIKTLRVAVYLSEKYHIPMPVAQGILDVIEQKIKPEILVKNFMKIGV